MPRGEKGRNTIANPPGSDEPIRSGRSSSPRPQPALLNATFLFALAAAQSGEAASCGRAAWRAASPAAPAPPLALTVEKWGNGAEELLGNKPQAPDVCSFHAPTQASLEAGAAYEAEISAELLWSLSFLLLPFNSHRGAVGVSAELEG